MRNSTLRAGDTSHYSKYDNEVTKAIDTQTIIAPQYGIVGMPPKFDPPPQSRGPRKNRFLRNGKKSSTPSVRALRTKDLKMCIAILEAELALVDSGQLGLKPSIVKAMTNRLQLMRAEKTRRDLRDLANGKTPPTRSMYSVGARLTKAA